MFLSQDDSKDKKEIRSLNPFLLRTRSLDENRFQTSILMAYESEENHKNSPQSSKIHEICASASTERLLISGITAIEIQGAEFQTCRIQDNSLSQTSRCQSPSCPQILQNEDACKQIKDASFEKASISQQLKMQVISEIKKSKESVVESG